MEMSTVTFGGRYATKNRRKQERDRNIGLAGFHILNEQSHGEITGLQIKYVLSRL
jgi:hypothetical protein